MSSKIHRSAAFSFELFPPKTDKGLENLEVTIEEDGHRAVVSLEVWRDERRLFRQYQALWLTTDPAERIPGGVPER